MNYSVIFPFSIMFLIFFVLIQIIVQQIHSQELQILSKPIVDDSILIRKLLTQRNNDGQNVRSLLARNNLGCSCQFFQGQNNLIPTSGYRWQKYVNAMPRSNGCGCQRRYDGVLSNSARYSNIGTKYQRQNILLPTNDIGCRCQPQNALSSSNINGWKCQQNALMPLNSIDFDYRRKNNLLPPRYDSNINRQNNIIRQNYIGCTCTKPNTLTNNIGCGCHRLALQNRLKDISMSNTLSITDLPGTILPNEISNKIRRDKEFVNRRKSLFDLKTRLAEMADLVSATANLISKLPTSYDVNNTVSDFSSNNIENENLKSMSDLPVFGS